MMPDGFVSPKRVSGVRDSRAPCTPPPHPRLHFQTAMWWPLLCLLPPASTLLHQIQPEKPKDFSIRLCSPERQPMKMETMLYFPESVKFCAALTTNKNVLSLARDRQRTTFLQPLLSVSLREIGGHSTCQINFMGYGGEYRLSPDLGFYTHCQRAISQYINQLVDRDSKPVWNSTNPQCPIQNLPPSYSDYLSCDLQPLRWYELEFQSAIRYEVFHQKTYRQFSANFSSAFVFKPDFVLHRNGTEIEWLSRLVELRAKLRRCEKVRYLLKIDEHWRYPIFASIDYRIVEDGYIKYSRHVGNGTIDHWFSGSFTFLPSPSREHQVCAKIEWKDSKKSFWLCRKVAVRGQCGYADSATNRHSPPTTAILLFLLFCAWASGKGR